MDKIYRIVARDEQTLSRLLNIWETSVKKTHTFLSENDIFEIRPEVYQALKTINILCCYDDDHEISRGFIGIAHKKIEMLFIADDARGQGIGKMLLDYAVDKWRVEFVDVNEQNKQGLGFYHHMGFHIVSRSEQDEQGRPFPIVRLALGRSRTPSPSLCRAQ